MKQLFIVLCAAVIILGSTGLAQAVVYIDFETDTIGAKPNGWTSNDSALVHFSDSNGANLDLYDYGDQGDGKSLAVNPDDMSQLIMDFDTFFTSMSLDFGNDDPGWINAGELAILTLFNGVTQVGQSTVGVNANDIMDQTISYSGNAFNKATFYYEALLRQRGGLIEVVDHITLGGGAQIPEPASMMLLASGLVGIAGLRRRK
ncbi:MAG: PEP-CTERM sorting domain-containing protein [Candidatus Omnitrophica bacterium]|nr:PEP-CTERM sorting domain-containing protein [Candidatus Omnitrophota bacterium]